MFEQFRSGDSASNAKSFDSSNLYQQISGPDEKTANTRVEGAGKDSPSTSWLPPVQFVELKQSEGAPNKREYLTEPEYHRKGDAAPSKGEYLTLPELHRKGDVAPSKGERHYLTLPELFQKAAPKIPTENSAVENANSPANQGKLMNTKDAHRVARTLGKYFHDIDQSVNGGFGDRYITGHEINDFLSSDKARNLTAQERADLQFAIKNERYISEASNDEWGKETSGITRADIGKLVEHNSPHAGDPITKDDADRVSKTLRKYYDKMDKHGSIVGANGFVDAEEIREFLGSPESKGLTPQEALDLARAARNAEMIARASNDVWGMEVQGITKADIEKLPGYIKN